MDIREEWKWITVCFVKIRWWPTHPSTFCVVLDYNASSDVILHAETKGNIQATHI